MKALEAPDRPILADDLLGGVLALVKRAHQKDELRAHNYSLQRLVHEMVRSGEYPTLARYFVFSDAGPEPHSPALAEAISRLQLAGLIGRQNPEYERITVSSTAERYLDLGVIPRLNKIQIEELERAAVLLAGRL